MNMKYEIRKKIFDRFRGDMPTGVDATGAYWDTPHRITKKKSWRRNCLVRNTFDEELFIRLRRGGSIYIHYIDMNGHINFFDMMSVNDFEDYLSKIKGHNFPDIPAAIQFWKDLGFEAKLEPFSQIV